MAGIMTQHRGTADDAQVMGDPQQVDRSEESGVRAAPPREHDGAPSDDARTFKRRIDCAPGRGARSWPGGRHR